MSDLTNPPLTIPAGTQVVFRDAICVGAGADRDAIPAGAVGIVVAVPERVDGDYSVRLPDGREVPVQRTQLSMRKAHRREGVLPPQPDQDSLRPYIIYRCVVGSRAYGLNDAASDTDRRGIYLPPASLHWSLAGVPEQIEDPAAQETYWELEKFVRLALQANPNVLECLYTPLVEHAAPLAEELRALRDRFLSKHLYQTYNGYKERPRRVKPLLYVFRVLLTGLHLMQTGAVEANLVTLNDSYKLSYIPELVARKLSGPEQGTLDERDMLLFMAEYTRLRGELEAAQASSQLPSEPSCWETVNDLLVHMRLGAA